MSDVQPEPPQKRKLSESLYRKPKGPLSPEARHRAGERRRKRRLAQAKAASKGLVKLRAIDMRFVVELVKNGGNPSAAAATVGLSRSTGSHWMHRPEIAAAYKAHIDALGEELFDYREAAARAKRTMMMLLDSPDEKVRMQAAKYLQDRHLGAVPQKIEAEVSHTRDVMTEIEMQAALSLVAGKGLTLAAAKAYVRENPAEVTAWWQSQQLIESEGTIMGTLMPGDAPRTHEVDPGRTNGGPEVGEGG